MAEAAKVSSQESGFRTIGEVARDLDVPQHVLRFWETKFKQIKPVKRKGGHRFYSQKDVNYIREIKGLLYDRGYTIKGAQNFLKTGASAVVPPVSIEDTQQDLFVSSALKENNEKIRSLEEKRKEKLLKIKNNLASLRDQIKSALKK